MVYRYTSYTDCAVPVQDQVWCISIPIIQTAVAAQDQVWCIGIPVIQTVLWLRRIKCGV